MIQIPERDTSGRNITRLASTQAGWVFLASFLEIDLGPTTTVYYKDHYGNDRYTYTIKHYDAASGGNVVTPANYNTNAVRTEITLRNIPDYEIISGAILNQTLASKNIRVHMVVGVIHPVTEAEISVKEMVGGANLKRYTGHFQLDGRSTKEMKQDLGLGIDANQVRITLHHELAATHSFDVEMEFYRQ